MPAAGLSNTKNKLDLHNKKTDGDAICSLRSFLFKNASETDLEIKTVNFIQF